MSDTVTVLGKVGSDPTRHETAGGVPVIRFRLASTQRRFDSRSNQWTDVHTNWYTVSAFRQLGDHAKTSLQRGDSVIVTGRVKVRDWEYQEKKYFSVDIEAATIGHDMRWGTSNYQRMNRADRPTGDAAPPAGDEWTVPGAGPNDGRAPSDGAPSDGAPADAHDGESTDATASDGADGARHPVLAGAGGWAGGGAEAEGASDDVPF